MKMIVFLALFIVLGINSYLDILCRQVSIIATALPSLIAVGILIMSGAGFGELQCISLVLGLLILCGCFLSGGKIGMGDGLVIMAMSVFLQAEYLGITIMLAAALAAVFGLIVMLFRYIRKQQLLGDGIPFVPFILCSFAGICLIYGNEVIGWV